MRVKITYQDLIRETTKEKLHSLTQKKEMARRIRERIKI